MRIILMIIIMTFLFGCKSNKGIEFNSNSKPSDLIDSQKDIFRVENDFLFVDSLILSNIDCNLTGFGTYLNYKKGEGFASIFYWDAQISECIIHRAYNGDQAAINLVADFIETIGSKFFDLRTDKFRGEKLFGKLLELANSDLCWDDDYGTPYGFEPMRAVVNAIKTVDGLDFKDWNKKNKHFSDSANFSKLCVRVQDIKATLIPLRLAWSEGKIELKAFGEQ